MELTPPELERYARQMILPEIGQQGQGKLKKAKVLLVGAGGLGSPVAIYLAAAGIGAIGLIDPDRVEISNLHRQIIHTTADIGKNKVVSAREKLTQLNPNIQVITYSERLQAQNALDIIQNYDLVVDGTDNFPSRYLINDACVFLEKSFIFGGILQFEGQCSIFGLKDGPCYRCIFEEPPAAGEVPSCAEAGVVGVLPGIIGLLQAHEVIKFVCGFGELLKGRLLIFDGFTTSFREVKIKKNPNCLICGPNRKIHKVVEYSLACAAPSPSSTAESSEITVAELRDLLKNHSQDICLIDVREQLEWDIAHIEGAILKPLSTLEKNYRDIPKNKKIFVHCKMGGRSRRAIEFLQTQGFTNLCNVKGGIDAWAQQIDPAMPKY